MNNHPKIEVYRNSLKQYKELLYYLKKTEFQNLLILHFLIEI